MKMLIYFIIFQNRTECFKDFRLKKRVFTYYYILKYIRLYICMKQDKAKIWNLFAKSANNNNNYRLRFIL